MRSFVAIDTETTGLGKDARIVEIGVVTFEDGKVAEEWSRLLRPEGVNWDDPNVKKAMEVNGIPLEELADKPTFSDVVGELLLQLSLDVWVAHNYEFDARMLRQEFTRTKYPPVEPLIGVCTKNLGAYLAPSAQHNKLADVASRYNVVQPGAHRAVVDARVCGEVLLAMLQKKQLPEDDTEFSSFCKQADASWSKRRYR